MVVRNVVRSPVRAVVQSVFGEGESFHPFQLFRSGAQGAWYDPSDFSTLYQDAAGTTPVTAVEQPVRLMLDRSRGLVLGSELRGTAAVVTAGTPAEAGTYNSATGEAYVYRTDGPNTAGITIPAVSGKMYRLQITIFTATAAIGVRPGISFGTILASFPNLIGTHEVLVAATSSELVLMLATNSTGQSFTLESVRELPGNHATAPSDASRPVLRARYNRLTRTEEFDGAWTKTNSTVTANAGVAPDGTTTADNLIPNTANAGHFVLQTYATLPQNAAATLTVYAKANGYNILRVQLSSFGANPLVYFDVSAGTVGTVANNSGNVTSQSITAVGNGWFRCQVTANPESGGTFTQAIFLVCQTDDVPTFTGDGTSGILIWGASVLTAADHAATGGAYQRIGAATDYDTGPPWRPYLAFDGSDDSMSTSSIDFSGTDKVTLFAGLTKLSDASLAVFAEISAASASNNGTFALFAPNPANLYTWRSRGTTSQDVNTGNPAYNAPDTSVLTGIGDISGDVATLRIDGAQVGTNTSDQGTGNYGNYPLFIGRRNNASLPFNGRLYGLTVLGRTATAPELSAMESWIAGKTGVSL